MGPTDLSTLERIFSTHGVTGALVVVILVTAWKYLPRLMEAMISFVQATQAQSLKSVQLSEKIAKRQRVHSHRTKQALEALRQSCDVIEAFARDSPHESEIKQHLASIRSVLATSGSRIIVKE
jgi:hypothetical protein